MLGFPEPNRNRFQAPQIRKRNPARFIDEQFHVATAFEKRRQYFLDFDQGEGRAETSMGTPTEAE